MSLAYAISGRSPQALGGFGSAFKHLVARGVKTAQKVAVATVAAPVRIIGGKNAAAKVGGFLSKIDPGGRALVAAGTSHPTAYNAPAPMSAPGGSSVISPVDTFGSGQQPGDPWSSSSGGSSMLPPPSDGGGGSSAPGPSAPVAAADAASTSIWQNPLTVPILALVGVGGYYLYHRYKNR